MPMSQMCYVLAAIHVIRYFDICTAILRSSTDPPWMSKLLFSYRQWLLIPQ